MEPDLYDTHPLPWRWSNDRDSFVDANNVIVDIRCHGRKIAAAINQGNGRLISQLSDRRLDDIERRLRRLEMSNIGPSVMP